MLKLLPFVLVAVAFFPWRVSCSMRCSPISFKIAAKADNVKFSHPPDPNNGSAILHFINTPSDQTTNGTVEVEGIFIIGGTYCRPLQSDRDAVQILVHGATYDRNYWTGFGISDTYNWPDFAAQRGYHTVAIDRLGHGTSDQHPDAIEGLQLPLQLEIIHQLITAFRHGGGPLGRSFKHIIYIGHSYSSVLGTALAGTYSKDADAFILTGHSIHPYPPALAPLNADLRPAQDVPRRFKKLLPGYLTLAHESAREAGFYGGNYDTSVARRDFNTEDTVTPGELLVQSAGFTAATGLRAPVMVVTGAEDGILCNRAVGSCVDILNATRVLFPDSRRYGYYAVPETGHDVNLHYEAPTVMRKVHDWLDEVLV